MYKLQNAKWPIRVSISVKRTNGDSWRISTKIPKEKAELVEEIVAISKNWIPKSATKGDDKQLTFGPMLKRPEKIDGSSVEQIERKKELDKRVRSEPCKLYPKSCAQCEGNCTYAGLNTGENPVIQSKCEEWGVQCGLSGCLNPTGCTDRIEGVQERLDRESAIAKAKKKVASRPRKKVGKQSIIDEAMGRTTVPLMNKVKVDKDGNELPYRKCDDWGDNCSVCNEDCAYKGSKVIRNPVNA